MALKPNAAQALLLKLTRLRDLPLPQARNLLADLLSSRVGDVIQVGAALEAKHALRDRAPDREIAHWQREIHERLLADAADRRRFVGQGINLQNAHIATSKRGAHLTFDGAIGELLALQCYLLVRTVGRDRLLVCVGCGELFIRHGKRGISKKRGITACSDKCYQKVFMQKVRAGEIEEG